jgi:CheY-like chemotaxis protein
VREVKESVAMTQKRALVVDDSRSARVALRGLLERHGILVEFAESGEEAIDFLKHQSVDVIFMDHTMPGMDGFEAVSVIKSDPSTAMIPVMMYTAKEGEVYVGQARALGAVGVLPKQVHPGVLFDMLLKLGLVKDRRAGKRRRATDAKSPPAAAKAIDETDLQLERQALGMSVQALITRVLQDQHLELRSDILASNRDFAKRVAEEIHAKQQAEVEQSEVEPPPKANVGVGVGTLAVALLIGLLPAAVLFFMLSQARHEQDVLRAENARLAEISEARSYEVESLRANLSSDVDVERFQTDSRFLGLVEALQWAMNEGNHFSFEAIPFDDVRLERLRELLSRLAAIGFTGVVQLDAHLGEFCLANDPNGGYRLAEAELSAVDCELLGHPLAGSASLSERQSLGFANFLASSPLVNQSGIEVQINAHGMRDSVRRYPFSGVRTAGEWNRIAELNNRVEYTLIPAE